MFSLLYYPGILAQIKKIVKYFSFANSSLSGSLRGEWGRIKILSGFVHVYVQLLPVAGVLMGRDFYGTEVFSKAEGGDGLVEGGK